MKGVIKKFLQKKGWYEYIRYSFIFSLYTSIFKRRVIANHNKEVSFYKSFLTHCKLIFDIGANDGHKTAAFLELADKVVCCEPDAFNFRVLTIRFRNKRTSVIPINKAVSDHTGTEEFHIHHPGSAFNTLNPKWKQILQDDNGKRWNENIRFTDTSTVELITLDELIRLFGKPGFIKIDVEGYEQHVLKGLSQKIPYITFECLLPDCRTELINCVDHLRSLSTDITFNVACEEVLLFSNFISYNELISWIPTATPNTFEIVAKM